MSYKLGEFLKSARGTLSLREVSKRTEQAGKTISHSMIAAIEKGINARGNEVKPNPEDLKILAKVYHVDYAKLLKLAGIIDNKVRTVPVPDLTTPVKVYGSIHAGGPMWAEENVIGQIAVTDRVKQEYGIENLFALIVKGQSMNRRVPEGVIAVFAKEVNIENGDIVAVLIDGQDATIKQYKETSMAVMFVPQSFDESFQPIIFQKQGEQDFRILGKMVYFIGGENI